MTVYIPLVIITSLLLGTCVQASALDDSAYASLVAGRYGLVVPENEGKYWFVQQYGWGPMDRIVDFAGKNGLQVHYHTLLWWYSLPEKPCEWIREAMSRYLEVEDWDIVNEGWNASGPTADLDIPAAYGCARETMPSARLWYNGVLDSEYEQGQALALLREGLADGIGIQMHLSVDSDLSTFVDFVREIEALGKVWRVSELDVRMELPPTQVDESKQREIYHQVSELCHQSAGCQSITVWGSDDAHSWIPGQWPGWGMATALTEGGLPKENWMELIK